MKEIRERDKFILFNDEKEELCTCIVANISEYREPCFKYALDIDCDRTFLNGDFAFVGDDWFIKNKDRIKWL